MRSLIIGCSGQDGTLLSELLLKSGWEVFGTYPGNTQLELNHPLYANPNARAVGVESHETIDVIAEISPDVIFYLAGITSVAESWQDPEITFEVNTVSYLKIFKFLEKNRLDTKIIYASSVEIFENLPILNEKSPMQGNSPYATSKIASTQLGMLYRDQKLIRVSNAILGNHESYLRDNRFVTGKIAEGVARIKLGLSEKITLGNINVSKNWSAAKDIVLGLKKLAEKDISEDIILAYPNNTSLIELIKLAFECIGIDNWENFVETDQALFRNNEEIARKYDTTKAKNILDWQAETAPKIWIKEMVDYQISQLSK